MCIYETVVYCRYWGWQMMWPVSAAQSAEINVVIVRFCKNVKERVVTWATVTETKLILGQKRFAESELKCYFALLLQLNRFDITHLICKKSDDKTVMVNKPTWGQVCACSAPYVTGLLQPCGYIRVNDRKWHINVNVTRHWLSSHPQLTRIVTSTLRPELGPLPTAVPPGEQCPLCSHRGLLGYHCSTGVIVNFHGLWLGSQFLLHSDSNSSWE